MQPDSSRNLLRVDLTSAVLPQPELPVPVPDVAKNRLSGSGIGTIMGAIQSPRETFCVSASLASPTPTSEHSEWLASIERLVQATQRQDAPALERLYHLTSGKLMGIAMRILQDEAEGADLLQEVYLKLWQRAHQFSGQGSAWGWLCVMTRNGALDRHKSRARRREDLAGDWLEQLLEQPEMGIDGADRQGLHCCLQQLRQEPREAILLSYLYGYSHEELMQRMAKPLGTIKAWIRRGLLELRTCLGG